LQTSVCAQISFTPKPTIEVMYSGGTAEILERHKESGGSLERQRLRSLRKGKRTEEMVSGVYHAT